MSSWVPSLLWTGGKQVFVNAASVESAVVVVVVVVVATAVRR